eukprot:COSAG02_NODE_46482_length_348_cov_1.044177_2_plen_40_part_01
MWPHYLQFVRAHQLVSSNQAVCVSLYDGLNERANPTVLTL